MNRSTHHVANKHIKTLSTKTKASQDGKIQKSVCGIKKGKTKNLTKMKQMGTKRERNTI